MEQLRYGFAEADRITGAPRGASKRWTRGWCRWRNDVQVACAPVTGGIRRPEASGISFHDLIEVATIIRLREIGLSLHRIREAVRRCQDTLALRRPLVAEWIRSEGSEFFLQGGDGPIEARAWHEVLDPFLDGIEYEGRVARRWLPEGRGLRVIVDPDYGFGLPVVAGSGVRTEIILEQWQGGRAHEQIAADFGVTREEVAHAIRFEESRSGA